MSSSSSGPLGSRPDGRSGRHASSRSNDVEPRGEHRRDRGHRWYAEDGPEWSCDRDRAPAPDLVERMSSARCPNTQWVADITYVPTPQGILYVAVVLEAFSRRVVGWSMAGHLRTELILDALDMAISRRRPSVGLIHHSDRGTQYTSIAFGRRCREAGIALSMGSTGTASITPWSRASSPASRPSSSTATHGGPGPTPDWRSSTTSRPCHPPPSALRPGLPVAGRVRKEVPFRDEGCLTYR